MGMRKLGMGDGRMGDQSESLHLDVAKIELRGALGKMQQLNAD
jgi:hypothetical protein